MIHHVCGILYVEPLKCQALHLHSYGTCYLFYTKYLQMLIFTKPSTEAKLRSHFQQITTFAQSPKTLFGTKQLFNLVILIELWKGITCMNRI